MIRGVLMALAASAILAAASCGGGGCPRTAQNPSPPVPGDPQRCQLPDPRTAAPSPGVRGNSPVSDLSFDLVIDADATSAGSDQQE